MKDIPAGHEIPAFILHFPVRAMEMGVMKL
jgi:hypothetical protein